MARRQFVLGPRAVGEDLGWRSWPVNGWVLSADPALPVVAAGDCLVLGTPVQTVAGTPPPAAQIAQAPDALEDARHDWAGRWMVVGRSVECDAGATLGCFYGESADGAAWASSSPALIADLLGEPMAAEDIPAADGLVFGGAIRDWYPPPHTPVRRAKRLAPSQRLELTDAGLRMTARATIPALPLHLPYPELIGRVRDRLITAIRHLSEHGPLWLPLTGGYDSRVILAALSASSEPAVTYTFQRPDLSTADRALPPALARLARLEHRKIAVGKPDPARARQFDDHCLRHHVGVDRSYVAGGSWDAIPEVAVVLRGGVFETARDYFHAVLPESADAEGLREAVAARLGPGFGEWLAWAARSPSAFADWRDRFYLEQRVGGWLSSVEQALDITGTGRAHVANCGALLAELLAMPVARRAASSHQADLIAAMAPRLLHLPFALHPWTAPHRAVGGFARAAVRRRRALSQVRGVARQTAGSRSPG